MVDVHGLSMSCPRAAHGLFVGSPWASISFQWVSLEQSMEGPRTIHGLSAVCLWTTFDVSVGFPWAVFCVDCPSTVRYLSAACLRAVSGLTSVGCPRGCPRAARGRFVGCPLAVRELYVGYTSQGMPMNTHQKVK